MNESLFIYISKDGLELPLIVTDTIEEMADQLEISVSHALEMLNDPDGRIKEVIYEDEEAEEVREIKNEY